MSPGILEVMMVKTARPSHLLICRNRFPARNDPSREIWIGLTDAVFFAGHSARDARHFQSWSDKGAAMIRLSELFGIHTLAKKSLLAPSPWMSSLNQKTTPFIVISRIRQTSEQNMLDLLANSSAPPPDPNLAAFRPSSHCKSAFWWSLEIPCSDLHCKHPHHNTPFLSSSFLSVTLLDSISPFSCLEMICTWQLEK